MVTRKSGSGKSKKAKQPETDKVKESTMKKPSPDGHRIFDPPTDSMDELDYHLKSIPRDVKAGKRSGAKASLTAKNTASNELLKKSVYGKEKTKGTITTTRKSRTLSPTSDASKSTVSSLGEALEAYDERRQPAAVTSGRERQSRRSGSKQSAAARSTTSKAESTIAAIKKFQQRAPAAGNEANDLKLSIRRLEVLVMQLKETNDEKETATILLEFALRLKNHELVVQGADLSVINTMKRFSNNAKIQTRGCKALAEISTKGLNSVESIIDKGGSEVILMAMEKHRAEEELHKEACRAIVCIAKSNQGKQSFGMNSKDAIAAILHSMIDHPNAIKLQRMTCLAMASIASDHAECAQTLVNKGGLESIRQTLRRHDDCPEILDAAFGALSSIASAVKKISLDEEVAMSVSLDRVLATMLLYRRDEKLQTQGIGLLCVLCKVSPRNRAKVATLYGLEIITKSLEMCIANKDVQRQGATLIQYLCQSEGNAVAAGLMTEGGMDLILNILRRHGSDAVIVQHIFVIIAKLARPFGDKIRKEGGIELVLTGMRRHEDLISVQEAACLALWKLSAAKEENKNTINANGGVTMINGALTRFPKDERIQEVACEALASLSHDRQFMLAQQTIKARSAAQKKNQNSVWKSLTSCGTVSCF